VTLNHDVNDTVKLKHVWTFADKILRLGGSYIFITLGLIADCSNIVSIARWYKLHWLEMLRIC